MPVWRLQIQFITAQTSAAPVIGPTAGCPVSAGGVSCVQAVPGCAPGHSECGTRAGLVHSEPAARLPRAEGGHPYSAGVTH